ncbi:MAG: leucine-rich repeat domain-containing protein [Eubacteriales bacterium]|nr:leucine-rich repeat domain-containing protein [Eubacteriales bacterium]
MSKRKEKKAKKQNDDFLAQEAMEEQETAPEYTLDIPEDEIWSYQIEGLQAPHINKSFSNAKIKKIAVVIILIVAIGFSIYFSVRAVHNDTYEYEALPDGTYELVKFSNPGDVTDITIDYVVDSETGEKDLTKPISVINEYAFNCDETLYSISLGKDVKSIDGKSIYSCWWVQNVWIDDENPYYCDLDGVIYTKDLTEIVFYPNDHDKYLREQLGFDNLLDDDGKPMEELWGTTERYDEEFLADYNEKIRTYVVPSTVETVGELAFAYSNITDLYLPEGLKTIEEMGVFKNTVLLNVYSYTTDKDISDTTYKAIPSFKSVYNSLPEGLEYIGSDAFTYDRGLSYMYIPASIKHIGHHAFWDTVYKEDGEIKGVGQIETGADEESFKSVEKGDHWRGQYDYKLFKKSVDVIYSAERK